MSRSKKKHNIGGYTTAASEKQDKKIWHSRLRAKVRSELKQIIDGELDADNFSSVLDREVSDVYCMGKDGKRIFLDVRLLRK